MSPITLASLKFFPAQLEQHFRAIPESHINWKPDSWEGVPSESLTALEQICHVRDIEIDGYQKRFRRMLDETHPTLESIDTYALIESRQYATTDPTSVFESIHAARAESMNLLESLSELQLSREGEFEGYGRVTIRSLVHYLCSHDQQHLSGLQWLMGKIHSEHKK